VLSDDSFAVAWSQCIRSYDDCDIFAQRFALQGGADCSGDCNGDGVVTIDELLTAVDLALRPYPDSGCSETVFCPSLDVDLDCQITVAEIIAAVNQALEGCD
jgi:hypothetical protein